MPRLIPSILVMAAVCAGNVSAAEPARPLVIAHRGASGYLPEHTLESYARAIDQGADYIEADLVVTKDGYLVARHENELSDTTDIALRFPNRKTTKTIDGRMVEGWFSEHFNLDELSTVRAKERLAFRDQSNNSHFHIPTIAEILTLRAAKQRETGRTIGVYIETKHPSYFRAMGLPMEEPLLSILTAWALDRPGSPVFLESFEADSVRRMGEGTAVPVIYLLAGDHRRKPGRHRAFRRGHRARQKPDRAGRCQGPHRTAYRSGGPRSPGRPPGASLYLPPGDTVPACDLCGRCGQRVLPVRAIGRRWGVYGYARSGVESLR